MNIPNKLTIVRIIVAFIFMGVLVSSIPLKGVMAFVLFAVACLTDFYDGKIARERNIVTNFGKLIDPLADKILISAALISFVQMPDTRVAMNGIVRYFVPAWMVVVIIGREFAVTGIRLLAASKGKVISAGKGGKHKIISQIVAISTILLFLGISSTETFLVVELLLILAATSTSSGSIRCTPLFDAFSIKSAAVSTESSSNDNPTS